MIAMPKTTKKKTTKKTAKKKTTKKATKKKTSKKTTKKKTTKVQKFRCPHCKKVIAVIDLESLEDTSAVNILGISRSRKGGEEFNPFPS